MQLLKIMAGRQVKMFNESTNVHAPLKYTETFYGHPRMCETIFPHHVVVP